MHAVLDKKNKLKQNPNKNLFWARGNSWLFVSMIDLYSKLPKSEVTNRTKLFTEITALEKSLRTYQDKETWLFHTLIRKENTYLETAGSAMIIYAVGKRRE